MEANLNFGGVDGDSQIAIIGIVEMLEQETCGLNGGLAFKVLYVRTELRFLSRLSLSPFDQTIYIVAAVTADDEGHLVIAFLEGQRSSKSLIIVGVP